MPHSTLKNPLDDFSSYSINHILLACRTTEEAKVFMDESQNGPSLAAIDQTKQLGEAVPLGNGNTAFLVIDTRRFSQFAIDKFQYEVLINGLEKTGSHGNLATKVDMTIVDAVGISFVNFIQWLMNDKMQTNFDGIIFMHRVVFVGHKPDGKTETVQSVTIPMHLVKLELALDSLRGVYTAEFMPNMNFNVADHQRWLSISDATTYFTGKGVNKLGPLIESFEKRLNESSDKYYQQAQAAMRASGRIADGENYGRKVQYQITIPNEWYSYTFTGSSTADATETVFKKLSAQDKEKQTVSQDAAAKADPKAPVPKDTHVSVETSRQITEVLDTIFSQVTAIAELGAGKKTVGETGSVTFYKHFIGITSDDSTVLVHVDVVPFIVPNVLIDKGSNQTVGQGDDNFYQPITEDGRRIPKNYMEFDYIFTGNNKDILNFDLKLQDLQWMLAAQLNLGPGVGGVIESTVPGRTPEQNKIDQRAELITARPYDAIMMPLGTKNEIENFNQYTKLLNGGEKLRALQATSDNMKNLSMFYAMAPITVVMTIRGNPDIMSKFNQNSFLEHTSASGASTTSTTNSGDKGIHSTYRENFEQRIINGNTQDTEAGQVSQLTNNNGTFTVTKTLGSMNYATMPVFTKININGPKVDFRTGASIVGGDFAERMLDDNFYVVMKVTNVIEKNVFTQQLELYSHNIFGMGKANIAVSPKVK
jgi:hypothetical protein